MMAEPDPKRSNPNFDRLAKARGLFPDEVEDFIEHLKEGGYEVYEMDYATMNELYIEWGEAGEI